MAEHLWNSVHTRADIYHSLAQHSFSAGRMRHEYKETVTDNINKSAWVRYHVLRAQMKIILSTEMLRNIFATEFLSFWIPYFVFCIVSKPTVVRSASSFRQNCKIITMTS